MDLVTKNLSKNLKSQQQTIDDIQKALKYIGYEV